jgi:hypothetical protein
VGDDQVPEQTIYWGVDAPGMTADQASWVVSTIKGGGLRLEPIRVDPAVFLTLHLDRESVKALVNGLASVPANPVSDGLRESLEDWLNWLGESG